MFASCSRDASHAHIQIVRLLPSDIQQNHSHHHIRPVDGVHKLWNGGRHPSAGHDAGGHGSEALLLTSLVERARHNCAFRSSGMFTSLLFSPSNTKSYLCSLLSDSFHSSCCCAASGERVGSAAISSPSTGPLDLSSFRSPPPPC